MIFTEDEFTKNNQFYESPLMKDDMLKTTLFQADDVFLQMGQSYEIVRANVAKSVNITSMVGENRQFKIIPEFIDYFREEYNLNDQSLHFPDKPIRLGDIEAQTAFGTLKLSFIIDEFKFEEKPVRGTKVAPKPKDSAFIFVFESSLLD